MTSPRSAHRLALLAPLVPLVLLPVLACSQVPPVKPPASAAETRSTRAADLRDAQALLLLLADQKRFEETVFVALLDSSKSIRLDLAVTLGRIGDARGRGLLQGLLIDIEPEVRRAAAFALGELGAPEAVPALLRASVDDDSETGTLAVEALGKLQAPLADVRRTLTAISARGGCPETRAGPFPLPGGRQGGGRGRAPGRSGTGARRGRGRSLRRHGARRRRLRPVSRRPPGGATVPACAPRGFGPEAAGLGGARSGRRGRARGFRRAGGAARRLRLLAPHPGRPDGSAHRRPDRGAAAARLGGAPRPARRRPSAGRPRHRPRILCGLACAAGGPQGRPRTARQRRAARARAGAPGARRGGRSGGARVGGARCGRPGAGDSGARRRGGGSARARRAGREAGARSGADGPGGGRRGPARHRRRNRGGGAFWRGSGGAAVPQARQRVRLV